MKKIIVAIVFLTVSLKSFSQTCEERESKLLTMMGSISAGFLYNTYGLIGSIADGYKHDAYDAVTVNDLLNAQNKLADNMINVLEKIIGDNTFKEQTNREYVAASVTIIKGLKTQLELFLVVVKKDTSKNLAAYNEQRKKNWQQLSKLMGIPE